MKRLIASISVVAVTLAGCSTNNGNKESDAHTLNIELPLKPASMAPYETDVPVRVGAAETLFKTTKHGEVEPNLVESYSQPSDRVLKLTLKDDIKFQNGHKLTGDAVKTSLEEGMKKGDLLKSTLPIKSIKAKGQDVEIETSEAFPELTSELSGPYTAIYDTKAKGDVKKAPIGTGPYEIKSYERAQTVALSKYDDYWKGKPKLDNINVKFNEDGSLRADHVIQGKTDLTTDVPVSKIEQVKNSEHSKVNSTYGYRTSLLMYNHKSKKMSKDVREALDKIIDRRQMTDKVSNGYATPAAGPFNSKIDFINNREVPKQDIEGAKALVEKAGYSKDKPLKVTIATYTGRPELPKVAEVIQSEAKKAHIDIQLRQVDDIEGFLKDTSAWDATMYSFGTFPRGDAGYFFNMAYKGDGDVNKGHYNNKEVNELIKQLNKTVDEKERHNLTNQILDVSSKDIPSSYIAYNDQVLAMNKDVTHIKATPEGIYLVDHKVDKK